MSDAAARLRTLLLERGVPPEEIRRAEQEGRLPLLTIDTVLLPTSRRYNEAEVAERTGIDVDRMRRFWRALGFPDVDADERGFTDMEVSALSALEVLERRWPTDESRLLQMARVVGSSMARIAEAEVNASAFGEAAAGSVEAAELVAMASDSIVTEARLLIYVWRRHLQAAIRRASMGQLLGGVNAGTVEAVVGFADLVGFTALSQQLSDYQLAQTIGRFESLAHDIVVALGGRVVKMIGDEVMYVVSDPASGVRIGLALAEAYADDEILSDVRVGVAMGSMVTYDGDYYGPTVNLASRMVNIARPGSVLVSDDVHDALAEVPAFRWRSMRPRYLKDIGRVQVWIARPVQPDGKRSSEPTRRFVTDDGLDLLSLLPESLREQVDRTREAGRSVLGKPGGDEPEGT